MGKPKKNRGDLLNPMPIWECPPSEMVDLGARVFAVQLVQLLYDLQVKKGWTKVSDVVMEIDRQNAQRMLAGDFNTCATHDFCDSNMALIYTMRIVGGLKKVGKDELFDYENKIWTRAKKAGFWNLYCGVMEE